MAKAEDRPRTMCQKILVNHGCVASETTSLIEVDVDQIALAREPNRILRAAVDAGLSHCATEVSLAYPPRCVSLDQNDQNLHSPHRVPSEALALGFLVARPGAGFAAAIHLERFSSPARLMLSDEPRLAACGAAAMLCLPASQAQLTEALLTGRATIRLPLSLRILLSGKLRPFVSVRDLSLELLRRGLHEAVKMADNHGQNPIVLEFGGPSVKLLSVQERATLCALAPQVGAASALFASDDRSEIFLREQRRSKAYRNLLPDNGAPWVDVISLDLSTIEPLLMTEPGRIFPVRELSGTPVGQVLLGGDNGISLRDWFVTAALLKSKKVAPGVDFLLCPPSRQILKVLADSSSLASLISSGARLIEADRRVITGELYQGSGPDVSLRNSDYQGLPSGFVASPETLAFAVSKGRIEDPREFKRFVRVTVPRQLPTDDVLLARGTEARGVARGKGRLDKRSGDVSARPPKSDRFGAPATRNHWDSSTPLQIMDRRSDIAEQPGKTTVPQAFVAASLEDLRWMVEKVPDHPEIRAVLATHIPAATVSVLSGLGVLALRTNAEFLRQVSESRELTLLLEDQVHNKSLSICLGRQNIEVDWLAQGIERTWTSGN